MNQYPAQVRLGARGFFAVAVLALAPAFALAQTAASTNTAADDASVTKLEKFVVTGSYIPYAADAPATPITTLSAAEISKSGVGGDLLEVIRKTIPQFTGGANLGSSNGDIGSGATGGGSQISLRNTNTLVLINGRRAAFNPIVAAAGFQFVDVNSIPVSAVDRIEVLTDGASATYGSDAVAGVVNIILRSDYEGLEIGGGYKHATGRGNWEERSARVITGGGTDKTKLTISAEWLKSDPIYYKDRDVSTPNYGTPTFPGVVQIGGSYYLLKESLNAPPANTDLSAAQLVANGTYTGPYSVAQITQIFNLAEKVTMQIANQKKAFTATFSHDASDALQLFGDVLFSKVNTFSQLNAQPITSPAAQTHVASDPRNPFDVTVRARNRFVDYPRQYLYDAESIRFMGGARGKLSDAVNYEIGANYNEVDQLYRNKNVIDRAKFTAAIAAGTLNLFARTQAAGVLENAQIFGTAYAVNVSRLQSFDGRIFGELPFSLTGGPVSYALGGEMRKETLSSQPDLGSYTDAFGTPVQWDGANPGNPFVATRKIDSLFAQVRLPFASRENGLPGARLLEADIALRMDKYNDTEDPTVPKVMLRWLPFSDEFAVRATYSKSFNAPTLFQMFGPSSIGNTPEILNFRTAAGTVEESLGQFDSRTDANPRLKPAKSTNYNLGLVYSPKSIKGAKIELSYFNIKQTDVISNYASQTVLQDVELNGANSIYRDYVRFGGFNGPRATAPGQVFNGQNGLDATVVNPYVNLSKVDQDGFDLGLSYSMPSDSLGRFDFALTGLVWNSYTIDGDETVGRATFANGTIPRYLAFLNVDWSRGNWSAGAGVQHLAGVDEFVDGQVLTVVPSFTVLDLRASYTFSGMDGAGKWLNGLTVRGGVNNVFDKAAPRAETVFSNANADTATYYTGMIGRVYYVDVTLKF